MPVTAAGPPVVKIGDSVYVGCGVRKATDELTILKYSITHDTWSHLPDCPTYHHGLATLDDELLVIGGKISEATNVVYTFRDKNSKWQEVLPPMPTPRYSLSTLAYENRVIIAAGGTTRRTRDGECEQTDIVEIYLKESNSWYSTKRLPFPMCNFSMEILNDKCFILGGIAGSYEDSSTMLYSTISSLIENTTVADPAEVRTTQPRTITWKKLQAKHLLIFPSLVGLDGRLVVVGGSVEQERRCGSKFISTYDFATDTWVECKGAELPLALYRPGLVTLDSFKVMIIGGQTKSQQFSRKVYPGYYCKPRYLISSC